MANRYLRANGNWNGPVWAATSGGTAGSAATPTSDDDVYITANYTVTLTADAECYGLWFGNGRINLNGNKLNVITEFSHTATTARTLDMTNGILSVGVTEYYGLNLNASGLSLVTNGSLVELNVSGSFGDSRASLDIGSKTINDLVVNLGTTQYFPNQSETLFILGSPTFRSLIIQSKNSAAHTVNFDDGAVVTINKFVGIGSSLGNRLTINGANDYITGVLSIPDGGSVYGQYLAMGCTADATSSTPQYIGSNSIMLPEGDYWLLQDPPKISTLVDPLTTAPGSNPNWTVESTDSYFFESITTGHGGGGYRLKYPGGPV